MYDTVTTSDERRALNARSTAAGRSSRWRAPCCTCASSQGGLECTVPVRIFEQATKGILLPLKRTLERPQRCLANDSMPVGGAANVLNDCSWLRTDTTLWERPGWPLATGIKPPLFELLFQGSNGFPPQCSRGCYTSLRIVSESSGRRPSQNALPNHRCLQ